MNARLAINKWFKSFGHGSYHTWHKELQLLYKNFPFLEQNHLLESDSTSLKQRYDKLYTEVYSDQEQAFNFLLANNKCLAESEHPNICREMEYYSQIFKRSSLIKRKKLLSNWNYKIIKSYVNELKKQNKYESITLRGLTEFPEVALSYIRVNLLTLKRIEIKQCSFSELPADFGKLNQMEEVLIEETPLLCLPKNFTWLRKLKKLIISDTELVDFPCMLTIMPDLKELKISNTRIKTIPDSPLVDRLLHKVGLKPQDILAQQKSEDNESKTLPNYWQARLHANNSHAECAAKR